MKLNILRKTALVLALGLTQGLWVGAATAEGFGPMNMMNPNKWFGNRDNDDDYYAGRGYGHPGYGAPGYGMPGYGGQPRGYGYAPPQPPQPPAAPSRSDGRSDSGDTAADRRIRELEERIRQLESRRAASGYAQPTHNYRPMDGAQGGSASAGQRPDGNYQQPYIPLDQNTASSQETPVWRPD